MIAAHPDKTKRPTNGGAKKVLRRWRAEHAAMQNRLCAICLRPLGQDVTLDHKIPLSRGGRHTFENTQAAHRRCNLQKDAPRKGSRPCTA